MKIVCVGGEDGLAQVCRRVLSALKVFVYTCVQMHQCTRASCCISAHVHHDALVHTCVLLFDCWNAHAFMRLELPTLAQGWGCLPANLNA